MLEHPPHRFASSFETREDEKNEDRGQEHGGLGVGVSSGPH